MTKENREKPIQPTNPKIAEPTDAAQAAPAEEAAHKARVRAAGEYVQERQAGILKKLAD